MAPPDILSGNGARADVSAIPAGIRHDDLTPAQQDGLERLIQHYVGRARDEVAAADWERIEDAGLAAITFAWAGPLEPGRGHYYAVRGPGFLVEYDNTQNDANHIHAVWRDLTNDWGEDAARRPLPPGPHGGPIGIPASAADWASPGMEFEHPSTLGRFHRTSRSTPSTMRMNLTPNGMLRARDQGCRERTRRARSGPARSLGPLPPGLGS